MVQLHLSCRFLAMDAVMFEPTSSLESRTRDFSKSSSRDCSIGFPRQIGAQFDQSVGTRPAFQSPLAFRSTGFESIVFYLFQEECAQMHMSIDGKVRALGERLYTMSTLRHNSEMRPSLAYIGIIQKRQSYHVVYIRTIAVSQSRN